jgi:dienelactone hydrolase
MSIGVRAVSSAAPAPPAIGTPEVPVQSLAVPNARTRPVLRSWRPPRPSRRHVVALVAVAIAVALGVTVGSTLAYLRLPAPTGAFGVGRADVLLSDPARVEPRSPGDAAREVRVVAWYPAEPGTGHDASYVPGLEQLRDGLTASGEMPAPVVAGLGFVQPHAREGAVPVGAPGDLPVLLLSPGNATNVTFYSTLAEELASHGFAVIGVDHPYQVAAVALADGVAVYSGDEAGGLEGSVARKIAERTADLGFVLDRLAADSAGIAPLAGRLDLDRVGVVGHSNGGIAAATLCATDARVDACMNVDGQSAGGPFSATPDPEAPTKPFLFLTKERTLHPALAELFEEGGTGTWRVVVPSVAHADFADGARFVPRGVPVDGTPDHALRIERGFARAFFNHALRGAPAEVLGRVDAPADVYVEAWPLRGRSTLPG